MQSWFSQEVTSQWINFAFLLFISPITKFISSTYDNTDGKSSASRLAPSVSDMSPIVT
jgi:hypothetical protein